MVVIGLVLFATMALVTPFMQHVLGYPILTVRACCSALARHRHAVQHDGGGPAAAVHRGAHAGRRRPRCSPRRRSTRWSISRPDASSQTIILVSIVQGVGLGLVFVPLSTVAFVTLGAAPAHRRQRDPDAGAQCRQLDRHLDRDRQSHQHDDADACAARRIRHAVQRRAADARRRQCAQSRHRGRQGHARRDRDRCRRP